MHRAVSSLFGMPEVGGQRREELEVDRRNLSHRVDRMDSRKAEPAQAIDDERVGGANRVAIAR